MLLSSLSTRERTLALLTGVTLGIALVWVTGIGPHLDTYKTLSGELSELQNTIDHQEQQFSTNRPYRADWRDLRKQLETAEAAAFWESFEKALLKEGVTISTQAKGSPDKKAKAGVQVVPFTLNLTGKRESIARLLVLIKQHPGFLRARTINITTKRWGTQSVAMTVSTLERIGKKRP